jgi:minor extracellular serine protease Vpr
MFSRRPLRVVVVLVSVSLAGPGLASFLVSRADQSTVTQQAKSAADPSLVQTLSQSTATVTALFELESVPVVAHEIAAASSAERANPVRIASPAAVDYEAALGMEQRDFEAEAVAVSPDLQVTSELRKLVNAVSVTGPAYEIARIAELPGVKKFQLSRQYHALLNTSVPLINAPAAWSKVGGGAFAGRGIKIAILDSGIDLTNPLFADGGFIAPSGFPRGNISFTNNKVIAARAFLQDQAATPADQNGHGTHVAGTAAGDFNTPTLLGPVSGVAPGAFLGNYRVLDSAGNGDEALIATALETAFTDGFDVADLSFGAPATATPGILDDAVEVAVVSGMTVVVAAGDDGAKGQMTITSPATALNAISVGASSNAHIVGSLLSVTGPGQVPAALRGIPAFVGGSCGPTAPFAIGSATLFDESLLDGKFRGSKAKRLPSGSLTGKVALIELGNCDIATKINNSAAAGAAAAVIYNQDISESPDGGDNLISPDTMGATIPSLFVTRSGGLAIKSWIDANPGATIRISGPAQFSQTPDVLAAFSAIGPTVQETLKPDLSAPGENIYSGAIKSCNLQGVTDPTGFTSVSGTSQAAAHVAGGAAILKQLHASWTVSQIKSALVNSTTAQVQASNGSGSPAGVLASGAGRLDLGAASEVGATLAPASLSFGVNSLKKLRKGAISLTQTLNITSVIPGVTIFSITADQPDGFTIAPSVDSLTLTQGETGQVQISIFASKRAQPGDVTGFIVVSYSKKQSVRAPFWAGL